MPTKPIRHFSSSRSAAPFQEASEYDPFLDPEVEIASLSRSPYGSVMKTIRPRALVGLIQHQAFTESTVTWRKSWPFTGYAVAIAKDRNELLGNHICDSRVLEDFWFANVDLLCKCYDHGVGTWTDPESGRIEIVCIWVTSSLEAAIERARLEGEPVYWDIAQRRFFFTS